MMPDKIMKKMNEYWLVSVEHTWTPWQRMDELLLNMSNTFVIPKVCKKELLVVS